MIYLDDKPRCHVYEDQQNPGLKNRSGTCEGLGWGLDEVKTRSEKCEGPGGGPQQNKEPEWEM